MQSASSVPTIVGTRGILYLESIHSRINLSYEGDAAEPDIDRPGGMISGPISDKPVYEESFLSKIALRVYQAF